MKFEIFQGVVVGGQSCGDWFWHMRARNGKIVADGGQGYTHPHDLVRTVKRYVARTVSQQGALARACIKAGLTTTGRVPKAKAKKA